MKCEYRRRQEIESVITLLLLGGRGKFSDRRVTPGRVTGDSGGGAQMTECTPIDDWDGAGLMGSAGPVNRLMRVFASACYGRCARVELEASGCVQD